MRRTDRLFELLQLFRGGRLRRGEDLAERLNISVRTVYRDIETLISSGIPIEAERGVGYILRQPIFLPPLTLTTSELEALNIGMRLAIAVSDEEVGVAAKSLLGKVDAVIPTNRPRSDGVWNFLIQHQPVGNSKPYLPMLRRAIRANLKTKITYRSLDDVISERAIRPLQLEYWGQVWTCTAWCELRADFRVFRIDKITSCEAGPEVFTTEKAKSLQRYLEMHVSCKEKS